MVFIMDNTLRYGERCTKQDITVFLRELADIYGYEPEEAKTLTRLYRNRCTAKRRKSAKI